MANTITLSIRLDPDTHAWLTELATTQYRTINQQIAYILSWYRLEHDQTPDASTTDTRHQ